MDSEDSESIISIAFESSIGNVITYHLTEDTESSTENSGPSSAYSSGTPEIPVGTLENSSTSPETSMDTSGNSTNTETQSENRSQPSSEDTLINETEEIESSEPAAKKPKIEECSDANISVDDDGALCPICLDKWSQSGAHRIASLKCGHLFGHSCILRWLLTSKCCPQCKAEASRKDIRFIYANKLLAVDKCEVARLEILVDVITAEKARIESELTKSICKQHNLREEVEGLKLQISDLRRTTYPTRLLPNEPKKISCNHKSSYQVCSQGSSGIMDYWSEKSNLVITMKSPTNLFQGFGVRVFNAETFSPQSYIPLHTKAIKDIKLQESTGRLLSVSVDKYLTVCDMTSQQSIMKNPCDEMLWSCCWHAGNENMVYVGSQHGSVTLFDLRYMAQEPLAQFEVGNDLSPVLSIVSVPSYPGTALPLGGFVVCKLTSLWAFEKREHSVQRHEMNIEGPFMSMTYNASNEQFLVSARPNHRDIFPRHIVSVLDNDSSDCVIMNRVHTFKGERMQKHIARSCLAEWEGTWFAATPEANRVPVWDCTTGMPAFNIRTNSSLQVLDVLAVNNKNGSYCATLNERKLELFQLNAQS